MSYASYATTKSNCRNMSPFILNGDMASEFNNDQEFGECDYDLYQAENELCGDWHC